MKFECIFAVFTPRTRLLKEINVHIFMFVCKRNIAKI
nr:MAG TPA: hypothetical protein [Caudoviricetes sp.]